MAKTKSTEPEVIVGSHLTVTKYPDGRTELVWDDEALTRDVLAALASVEKTASKPKKAKKVVEEAVEEKPKKKATAKKEVVEEKPKKAAAKKTTSKKKTK